MIKGLSVKGWMIFELEEGMEVGENSLEMERGKGDVSNQDPVLFQVELKPEEAEVGKSSHSEVFSKP